jgi:lytic murein transglycosylase
MRLGILAATALALGVSPALAVQCEPPGGFPAFLSAFHKYAAAEGVGPRGLAALDGLTLDRNVLSRDRRQGVFRQSFEQFSGRMISRDRMVKGERYLKTMAPTFRRIEERYGVPGGVLVAIWAMETDFGVNQGHFSVLRSVATLAYDCRRSEKFQTELLDGLRIVDSGKLSPAQLRGDWAGEIGQTQFIPSSWLKYAVDFDGDGRIDLAHSAADALGSTANYLQAHGWKRGAGWGPGEPNFEVIKTWNKADVYARTIALFGQKLQEASR